MKTFHLVYDNDPVRHLKMIGEHDTGFGKAFQIEFDQDLAKKLVIRICAGICKVYYSVLKQPVSLRIHGLDGKIEQERTYPRSADPQESKG